MAGLEQYWYKKSAWHLILLPVSWLFGLLAGIRCRMYHYGLFPSFRLPVPVVVIGNISVGGTGKTPLTLSLAEQLTGLGHHPLIISRGYGGNAKQQQVHQHSHVTDVGDEPLLMAQRGLCPVWVGHDRVATAREALASYPPCDVVLCDDGLQHYRLQRDMEIAVIDGVRYFGNGHLLPAGPLREPASRLESVDAVVINGGALPAPFSPTFPRCKDEAVYAMQLTGTIFYNLRDPGRTAQAENFRGLRLHAVAGIGHPQRFFDHLNSLGLTATCHAFPDHHPYLSQDLSFEACDALLMTEKDAVKCAAYADDHFWVLRVTAQLNPPLIHHLLRKTALYGRKTA